MPAKHVYITAIEKNLELFFEKQKVSSDTRETLVLFVYEFLKDYTHTDPWEKNFEAFSKKNENTYTYAPKIEALSKKFFEYFPPSQTQVYLSLFLNDLKNSDASKSTLKNYRSDLKQLIAFSNTYTLHETFSPESLEQFVKHEQAKGLKITSIKRKVSSFSQFLVWAKSNGILKVYIEPAQTLNKIFNEDKNVNTTSEKLATSQNVYPAQTTASKPVQPQLFPAALPEKNDKKNTETNLEFRKNYQFNLRSLQKLLPIVNIIVILLFFLGISIFGYQQFIAETETISAFPSTLVRPRRSLSFQGRLTDTAQNPITTSTNFDFELYDALTGGNKLWDSNTCAITPDQDGIFNAGLGDDCGSEITSDVFSENANVWLEVKVGAETLTPRQPIQTVAYALNAETLQGYPASASAVENTVLVMNNSGQVVLGNSTPLLKSTGTSFAIEANSLTLQTTTASGGDITLDPDGADVVLSDGSTLIIGGVTSATYNTISNSGTANIASSDNDLYIEDILEVDGEIEVDGTLDVDGAADFSGGLTNSTGELLVSGGNFQINDDIDFQIGTDADWTFNFDEDVDDQLLLTTTKTAATATTDPLFEILVPTTPTEDQQLFGIAKGSQATNTALFTLDEDGDLFVNGDITINGNNISSSTGTPITLSGDDVTFADNISLTANTDLIINSIEIGAVGSDNITSGASLIGVYHTELANSSSTNIQDVLDDLDAAIGAAAGTPGGSDTQIQYNNGGAFGGTSSFTFNDSTLALTISDDLDLTFAGTENLAITSDLAGTIDAVNITTTPSSTAGTTSGIYIDQANSANTNGLDSALVIDNSDADLAITNGIQFTDAGGGFTNLFNVNGTLISAAEFSILDSNIDLTSEVTGVLPIANGGTNKSLTLDAGGIFYSDADSFEILAAGTSGQLLTSGGAGAPTWTTQGSGGGLNADTLDSIDSLSFLRSDTSDAFTSGTLTFNDSTTLALGTANDFTISHGGTNTVFDNTFATGATQFQLGTDTAATDFQILNNTGSTLFELNGAGTLTLNGVSASTDSTVLLLNASNQVIQDEIDSRVFGSTLVDGSGTANYVPYFSDSDTLADSTIYFDGTNVGIGTTSPTTNLHIYQDSPSANQALFRIGTSDDSDRFFIDEDGDATLDGGITVGTGQYVNAGGTLNLRASAQTFLTGSTTYVDVFEPLRLSSTYINSASTGQVSLPVRAIPSQTGDLFQWQNSSGTALGVIDVDGKVGIGNSSPVGLLDVDGAVTGKALTILNETGDQNILAASASGTTVAILDRSGNLSTYGTTLGLNNDADSNNIFTFNAAAAGTASGDLYWGNDLVCDVSEANCGWATAAAGGITSFTLAGDSGGGQTITDGNTVTIAGGTNGIDTIDSATDTVTINLDTTEIGTTTFGSGSGFTWTFNAGATDPTLAFASDSITLDAATFDIDSSTLNIATQATDIEIADNTASALTVTEGANNYLGVTTTDSSEVLTFGNATTNPDFTFAGSGTLSVAGTTDLNGDLSIADTNIAFDGASTTFTTTGAFTLTPGGATLIGDGGDTLQINSSDWDISTTGDLTGIGAITADGTITLSSVAASTDNTVLLLNASNQVIQDEIDSRVFGSSLVDGSGTTNYLAKFSDTDTLTSSVIYDDGADVGLGTTNPTSQLHLVETETGTSSNISSIDQDWTLNPSGATSATYYGIDLDVLPTGTQNFTGDIFGINTRVLNDTSGNVNTIYGNYNQLNNLNTGTVATAYGNYNYIYANGGNITTAYGVYADFLEDSGAFTNAYGIYLSETGASTNAYGVYQAGATDDNYFAGNVGIGNSSPVGLLDVSGAVTGKALTILNETGDQNILAASASGTTVAILDRNGNLSTYGTTLGLNNDADANNIFTFNAAAAGTASGDLYWGNDLVCDVSEANCGWATTATGMSTFTVAGDSGGGQAITDSNTLTIAGGTNITTVDSVTDTLTINLDDSITLAGTLAVNGDSITSDGATLVINAVGAVDIQDNLTADSLTLDTGDITLRNGETIANGINTEIALSDGTNTLTVDFDEDTSTAIDFTTNGSVDLTFNPGGNVGIGTTTPSSKLHVNGDVRIPTSSKFYFESSGTSNSLYRVSADGSSALTSPADIIFGSGSLAAEYARITSAGRLGIGTDSPNDQVEILSTSDAQLRLAYDTSNYTALQVASDGGLTWSALGTDADLNFDFSGATDGDFSINSDDLFVDTSTGNVGIGVTSLSDRFVVDGTNGTNGISIARPSDSAAMKALSAPDASTLKVGGGNQNYVDIYAHLTQVARFDDTGRVGIGTTSLDSLFKVNGAATGKALTILNETGDQNILAASASGTTVAILDRNGNLSTYGTTLGLNNDADSNNIFSFNTGAAGVASGDLYWGNDLVCDVSATNCGWGTFSSFTLAGDSGGGRTITDGNTLTIAGGTNGIDTVDSDTDTVTINLDTTEIGTTTFGAGSGLTWTFDAGATDPTIAFSSDQINITSAGTKLISTEYDAYDITPAALDIQGAVLRIGDANSGATFTNGMGIKFHDTGVAHGSLIFDSTNNKFRFGASSASGDSLAISNEPLTVDLSNSRVGINSATPQYTLDVVADDSAGSQLTIRGASNGNNRLYMGYNTTSDYARIQAITEGTSTRPLVLQDSGGNVGIGDTTPAAKLDVGGGTAVNIDGTNDLLVLDDIEVNDDLFVNDDLTVAGGAINLTAATNVDLATNASALTFETDLLVLDTSNDGIDITTGATTTDALDFTFNSLTTGTGIDLDANALTTGDAINITSTSTALTTGSFLDLYWNPGSSTSYSGDLFKLDVGANAVVTGNLLALYDNGSDVFKVGTSQIESAVPHLFSAAGDISAAYDIVLTNQTASKLESYGPLTIAGGESFESNNLTLKTYNSGNIVFDTPGDGYASFTGAVSFGSQQTFTDSDATPDVSGGSHFITNTSAVTITDFDAGSGSLEAGHLIFVESNGTITFDITSSGLNGGSTTDLVTGAGDTTTWIYDGTDWNLISWMDDSDIQTGADLAEYYPSNQSLQPGEVVAVDGVSPVYVKKTNSSYQTNAIGIVATDPGITLGEKSDNSYAIALAGRVPVKINPNSPAIKQGDPITSSALAGFAQKAVKEGQIVGKALEDWTPGSGAPTIMVFVNNSWYNPLADLNLNTYGELALNESPTGTIAVSRQGSILENVIAAAKGMLGKIEAGFISTKELVVERDARISHLTVDSLTIEGELLSPLVTTSITTDSLNVAKTATVSGSLTAGKTKLTDLLVEKTATVSGSLIVEQNAEIKGELRANSTRLAKLEAETAKLKQIEAQTAYFMNATVSGTLFADSIYDFENKVAKVLTEPSLIDLFSGDVPEASESTSLAYLYEELDGVGYTATGAAELNFSAADLNLDEDAVILASNASFIDQYLKVNGAAYISTSLGVGQEVIIGTGMHISDGVISYLATEENTQHLSIQPEGKGSLSLLGDLLILDESGLATINGDAKVTGNLEVEKTLLTNLISTPNFDNPLQVQVAGVATNSAEVKKSRFEIINELGTPVATISAEGKASFAAGIGVGSEKFESTESAQISTTKSSGKAVVPAGSSEIKINTTALSSDSLIYVTPQGSTGNQVLFVKSQQVEQESQQNADPYFVAGFDNPTQNDVIFTWWIVN